MILFLDFDGVLHPEYDGQATPADVVFCHLPRFEAVMRDHPEVEIVISSTWREQFPLAPCGRGSHQTLRAGSSAQRRSRLALTANTCQPAARVKFSTG
ncbi:HAD domain-containing protein [Metapseudomonas otitidis]|uniref:HAD domain-containing protein n=1 Tax=Metapseudomonas otitidis TaxID=319939 RepID=UPI001980430B|nr:HAD domain-containing protein [Pseudomonas otitidis]